MTVSARRQLRAGHVVRSGLSSTGGALLIGLHLVLARPLRHWRESWGATNLEVDSTLPGDDSVPQPGWSYTHAISVDATPDRVWPWIAQLGQQKGGFYSYHGLENMLGCHVVTTNAIDPAFGCLALGDTVFLHPKSPPLQVVSIESGHHLVLLGHDPETSDRALWSFHLASGPNGTARLIERGRYSNGPSLLSRLAFGPTFLEPIGFVMSRKILLTLRRCAELTA